jgi:hypothetical protein
MPGHRPCEVSRMIEDGSRVGASSSATTASGSRSHRVRSRSICHHSASGLAGGSRRPDGQRHGPGALPGRETCGWIVRQRRFFEQYQRPLGRRYISGETHLYMGRQYRLKVQAGSPEHFKLAGRSPCADGIGTRPTGSELLDAWYREHAASLPASAGGVPGGDSLLERVARRTYHPSHGQAMGSCTPTGKHLLTST